MEVCSEMQKLLDISNASTPVYDDEIDPEDLVSWDDSVLAQTDESIKDSIKRNNEEIDHMEKCKHKGCIQLGKNWKAGGVWKRYTNRESMLTGKRPRF